jgi:acyl-CoA reductase-like NAD-dependent aldehyde dehydrogenase
MTFLNATETPSTLAHWEAAAAKLKPETGLFIDGRFCAAVSGQTFDTINPANGQLLAQMAKGDAADIDKAVANATAAWQDKRWRGMAPTDRMAVMLKWADLMEAHQHELALLETLDMGKPIRDMLGIDIPEVLKTIRYFAQCIDKIEGAVTHTAESAQHIIVHEPLGVVGAITPWNYPMLMALWKVAPILAAGNCVVLKPAEQSPLTAGRMAQLFVAAGGPAGVFNVVNGFGIEAGKALALHNDIIKLSFTGSTAIGKQLLMYAGQSNMKRVALETGGKSPQIFMPDLYDLDAAVDRAIGGIYDNAGQVCNAGSRLIVHSSIHDDFVQRFVARTASAYATGNPLDPNTSMGPLVSTRQQSNVMQHIAHALEDGAGLAMGGAVGEGAFASGAYVQPTLFVGGQPNMRIVREEVFGPVTVVQKFDTEAQAIALANDCQYGLAASVWTSDLRAAHRVTSQLEAGVLWVNCFGDGDMTQPFGGYKLSGNSRDKHMMSLLGYTQAKSVWTSLA